MRVYLPGTADSLRELMREREFGASVTTGFAVTPGLREWYVDDDVEALEYAAMLEAARASLRLIDAAPGVVRRRVVLAADVASENLSVRDDLDRGVVRVSGRVPMSAIAAVHLDDEDAEDAVAAAAAAITAADLGQQAAQDTVDDAEGFELAWYATQEIESVLAQL